MLSVNSEDSSIEIILTEAQRPKGLKISTEFSNLRNNIKKSSIHTIRVPEKPEERDMVVGWPTVIWKLPTFGEKHQKVQQTEQDKYKENHTQIHHSHNQTAETREKEEVLKATKGKTIIRMMITDFSKQARRE